MEKILVGQSNNDVIEFREMGDKIFVISDGSVNTKTKIGVGAYLMFSAETESDFDKLSENVKTVLIENTSSTKLELQICNYVLGKMNSDQEILFYTDSQNTVGLLNRREKLEKANYHTSSGKLHKNHELYKEFFKLTDKLDCKFIKVKGHQRKSEMDEIGKLFSIVDKAARRALRENK